MILYALERLFDYLFQYLVANLVINLQNDKNLLNQNEVTASDEPSNNDLSPQSDTPYDVSSSESPDKTCHINVCYMDPVQKRIVNYNMEVNRSMKVEDVKRQLQGQLNGMSCLCFINRWLTIFFHLSHAQTRLKTGQILPFFLWARNYPMAW